MRSGGAHQPNSSTKVVLNCPESPIKHCALCFISHSLPAHTYCRKDTTVTNSECSTSIKHLSLIYCANSWPHFSDQLVCLEQQSFLWLPLIPPQPFFALNKVFLILTCFPFLHIEQEIFSEAHSGKECKSRLWVILLLPEWYGLADIHFLYWTQHAKKQHYTFKKNFLSVALQLR